MRGLILTAAALALGATLGGCFTEGEVGYTTTTPQGTVYDSNPDLVTVTPGVQVVADYDEPVFYTDGFYWRFYDGYWYRSNNYYSGWYFYERPPVAVLRIDRPYAYVHYRPRGYVARSNVRHRRPEVIVRDHRDRRAPTVYQAPASREPVRTSPTIVRDHRDSAPAPVVRDHREADKDTRDHRRH